MSATFNHTIIAAKDRTVSAAFYRDVLEAADAPSWGFFTNLQLDGGVLLQFAEPPVEIQMQHYAFLVDDDLFDRAYALLRERGIEHWADPQMRRPGETNTEHGGRGVYFKDPAGHALELITRPYLRSQEQPERRPHDDDTPRGRAGPSLPAHGCPHQVFRHRGG